MATVLVTGGSGFVGSHIVLRLLEAGHQVRTTVRNLAREADVRGMLKAGGAAALDRLTFYAADLEQEAGWTEAMAGCDYVMHVASPFPAGIPKDEGQLIRPALGGTLRVLRAARAAGVKRVVMTSSFAAIGYGNVPASGVFTEENWSDLNAPDAQPYMKSKTLAEQAAWDFVGTEGNGMELSAINPVGIFGPVLGPDLSSSVAIIRMMLNGAMPGAPRIYFGVVDVRDVANLHVIAMIHPAAAGERFIASAGRCVSVIEVARLLRARLGDAARRVPRHEFPDWLVRLIGRFNTSAREIVPQLGIRREASGDKARTRLGWNPRSNEEAIVASAESLIQLHLVKES